jgi:solute carrier family 25 phosphate transporter 23/24/25/41
MNAGDCVATSAAMAVVARNSRTSQPDLITTLRALASNDTYSTLTAGMIAGSVSRTLTAPLDRLKTLAQEGLVGNNIRHANEFARMRFLTRQVYTTGGVKAFWRGNGANCLKAGPEYAIAFTARQHLADRICRNSARPTGPENFFLGAMSGLTAQTLLYPLEVTKTRMAVAKAGEYYGIADCINQSVRRGGVRDLYRGLAANLAGVVPHRSIEMGLFFTGTQALRRWNGDKAPSLPLVSLVGFAASIVGQIATYPLNLARTKLQTQGVNGRPMQYRNLPHCLVTVARADGARGLFVGLAPNMLKAAPASTIMYTCFHSTKEFLTATKQPDI